MSCEHTQVLVNAMQNETKKCKYSLKIAEELCLCVCVCVMREVDRGAEAALRAGRCAGHHCIPVSSKLI